MSDARSHREEARTKILTMYWRGRPTMPDPREEAMNVLIADDDPGFRAALRRHLEAREEIGRVWEAVDGEEAIHYTRALNPDVIFIDLAMPRIGGLEATRLIKSDHPEISVVVCSVHNESIYRRVAALNGADSFVSKSSIPEGIEFIHRLSGEDPK
jgi:DNA-binding NarL/FixJ family response regulator